MFQAGINKVVLYEDNGLLFTYYDLANLSKITSLTNIGQQITIENNQRSDFDLSIIIGMNNRAVYDYVLSFFILGFTTANLDQLIALKESIYGWKPLFYLYDGTMKFFNTPLFFIEDSGMKLQEAFNFTCELRTRVGTIQPFLNYLPGSALTFKADTTYLTADSTLITADYV